MFKETLAALARLPGWAKITSVVLLSAAVMGANSPPPREQGDVQSAVDTTNVRELIQEEPTTVKEPTVRATNTIVPTSAPTTAPTATPQPMRAATSTPWPSRTPAPTTKVVQETYTAPVQESYTYQEPTSAPVQDTGSGYTCNCAKTCPNLSCAEAQYQLNVCGCQERDADNDGVACDSACQ